jgi:hypothetical protein
MELLFTKYISYEENFMWKIMNIRMGQEVSMN